MNLARLRATAAAATTAPDPDLSEAKAEWEQRQAEAAWSRTAVRKGQASTSYGMRSGAFPCLSCGCFKPEPAAVCGQCGDDPVSHHGDAHDFNRAYGYAS